MSALAIGSEVTFYDPGSRKEHESWQHGRIVETLELRAEFASGVVTAARVHIVAIDGHKWEREAPWGPYDGLPFSIGSEVDGSRLAFRGALSNWPLSPGDWLRSASLVLSLITRREKDG